MSVFLFLNCRITAKSNKLYVDCLSIMAIMKCCSKFFFSIEKVKIGHICYFSESNFIYLLSLYCYQSSKWSWWMDGGEGHDISISKILVTALPVHTEYCIMTISYCFSAVYTAASQCTVSTVLWQCRVFTLFTLNHLCSANLLCL